MAFSMRRKIIRYAFAATWLTLVLLIPPSAEQAQADIVPAKSPKALIGEFHDALLMVMQNAGSLGYNGRYKQLGPHVRTAFHLRLMIQIASGPHWRNASESQKLDLVAAFGKVTIGTYAARFDGFSGQSFKTLTTKPGPQGTQMVETRLINPGGGDVELTYVTKQVKGSWRIIDVILDTGISELALRRSEYRRILKQSGIDALIAILNAKAAALDH